VSKQSEVVYINGAPSTPGYLLALVRELSHVPRGHTEIAEVKQVRKTNQSGFCTNSKKGLESRSSHFEPKNSLIAFSRGSGPPLNSPPRSKNSFHGLVALPESIIECYKLETLNFNP